MSYVHHTILIVDGDTDQAHFTRLAPIDELNRAYELGCNSYLVKPTSFNTLLVMMQSVVQYWLALNHGPEVGPAPAYGLRLPQQGLPGEGRHGPGA